MTYCRLFVFSWEFEKLNNEMSALANTNSITSEWVGIVAKQVESLRFGVVQITVHESRVVQIEKTEKVRLEPVQKKEAR